MGTRNNNSRDIRLIFRQLANPDSNQLWRVNSTQGDLYGGLFTSTSKIVMKTVDRMLHEFRERSFFHLPMRHTLLAHGFPLLWPISPFIFPGYKHPHTFVLNTEEIATLWHFPTITMKAPLVKKSESKRGEPPVGLPITFLEETLPGFIPPKEEEHKQTHFSEFNEEEQERSEQ